MLKRKAEIDIGTDHIIVERRYRALGAFNDLLIAMWFLIGSVFFFYNSMMNNGTWLFVAGSLQLLLRPVITLAELIHVRRDHARR
ncbi:YrhK family protein [Erwinia sp. S63]|uniref:YrhK family protein n=1 Tax=Erwiniaceae TaxID=1903409 RepID=UPI00190E3FD8|nr:MULTISPECIES: YrhK family protein [Erwiniaceae]MBK0004755.1 YrhK family protein [Erwinia sp. S38]MBK0094327.1 YrhK family protein [Erwinia sp. S59]MBK0099690.1 YrhK family protein [Erwinia sp. S63]MBK0127914.1 YrhK family protein [Pantoea sp. S61]